MKRLNYENMLVTYYESNADEYVWNAFVKLNDLGFIGEITWTLFRSACHDWHYDEEHGEIRDGWNKPATESRDLATFLRLRKEDNG